MTAAPPSFSESQPRAELPHAPILIVGPRRALFFTPDEECVPLDFSDAARKVYDAPPMACHGAALAQRLSIPPFPVFDVLELFAFVRPAVFCLPTVNGLAEACGLASGGDMEEQAKILRAVVRRLLDETAGFTGRNAVRARCAAQSMARGGWVWASSVLAALGGEQTALHRDSASTGLRVWEHLPETSDYGPVAPPSQHPVSPRQARERLAELLGPGAEDRPQQADYASACCGAFAPREERGRPCVVLAEAGTGVGKTLGYIAPASLWSEQNGGAVWISTYTRNLQHQLDVELSRLYPDPMLKARHVVVRKGRENYLCLLNFEDALRRLSADPKQAIALGLAARWVLATRDGDMTGGDFPGWLPDIAGRAAFSALMDRHGECVFSACPHYHRCFIERSIRKARRARLVVSNHALTLIALSRDESDDDEGGEESSLAARYVFDEGHHLFDAADSAFSVHLTGQESAEMRRWLLGGEEQGRSSRARGLKWRAEEVVAADAEAAAALQDVTAAVRCLPSPAWMMRVSEGVPQGPTERFLALAYRQVYARTSGKDPSFSLESDCAQVEPELREAALALKQAYRNLSVPLEVFCHLVAALPETQAETMETAQRMRIDGLLHSISCRILKPLRAWQDMLADVGDGLSSTPDSDNPFVDWFGIERLHGRDVDVGMHRHWRDPTEPLARSWSRSAHGVVVTSATLRDGSGSPDEDWRVAEERTGGRYLMSPPVRAAVASPFDYSKQTRVFVVVDVCKGDPGRVAAAYRALMLASRGGALGLFTAVARLKDVYDRVAAPLDEAGIPLYAQHVDGMDASTLIDIFRAERDACLLGTDAVRDGIDVPGNSLRLIVFDRVPWPRPTVLHRERRACFGGGAYDDSLTRLRLKQAFGRLVRRAEDRGVFVLLDPRLPSRLSGAFPEGVAIQRLGLAEAVTETRLFLSSAAPVVGAEPQASGEKGGGREDGARQGE